MPRIILYPRAMYNPQIFCLDQCDALFVVDDAITHLSKCLHRDAAAAAAAGENQKSKAEQVPP